VHRVLCGNCARNGELRACSSAYLTSVVEFGTN